MRLVRLGQQPSRVAEDVRAALASLGRGSTVIGGVALIGARPADERAVEAVVLLPTGVLIVIGVDLPDPALRLEAPLSGPWKADGWPLVHGDDAINPATEALDLSQDCERRIAELGGGPVGTILAVGPYVETVEQPPGDLAGPVRVLHPSPTTMLAATVSLATARHPRSVDQVRALLAALAPGLPDLSDEALLGEGFVRFSDDTPAPAEMLGTVPGPAVSPESGRGAAEEPDAAVLAAAGGAAVSGAVGGAAASGAAVSGAVGRDSAEGSGRTATAWTSRRIVTEEEDTAAGTTVGVPAVTGNAAPAAAVVPGQGGAGMSEMAAAAETSVGETSGQAAAESAAVSPVADDPVSEPDRVPESLGGPAAPRRAVASPAETIAPESVGDSAGPNPGSAAGPATSADPGDSVTGPWPGQSGDSGDSSSPSDSRGSDDPGNAEAHKPRVASGPPPPPVAPAIWPEPGEEDDLALLSETPAEPGGRINGKTPFPAVQPGVDESARPAPVALEETDAMPPPPDEPKTTKTSRWVPLGAIALLVVLAVAAVVVATGGGSSGETAAPPPVSSAQPVRTTAPVSIAPPSSVVPSLSFDARANSADQRCASHAFGDVQGSLQQTSCSGVRRASFTAEVDGRAAAVTVAVVEFPGAAQAAHFKEIADNPGGGGILDVASETGTWPGAVPQFENAAYVSRIEGTGVRLVQAVWTPGPSTSDDPGLVRAAKGALELPLTS
ncbi:hypothetical protein ATK36_1595 [Amycolatopsis sulphurea]|uniref:Uncharacterized protein n=1 Tax=Amycolatopsis sulphurea TaxID=76022 RepID=A0A2A9F714_9PSEU|nr:hypothetical protein [Amycolatopsis sulphurea]PFG46606.1 hypothetical protein ATK36_1595 [Amycolatopsis sulphurea]